MPQTSSCRAVWCGTVVQGEVPRCPRCNRRTVSSRQIRIFGVLLLFLGSLLVGGMVFLTIWLAPFLLNPGVSQGGTRFTGTPEQAKMIIGVFAIVAALGVGACFGGGWQLVTGRRNKWVVLGALIVAFVFVGGSILLEIYTEFF